MNCVSWLRFGNVVSGRLRMLLGMRQSLSLTDAPLGLGPRPELRRASASPVTAFPSPSPSGVFVSL
jgi:hypothetical protein